MTAVLSPTGELVRDFIAALNPAARAALVDKVGIDAHRTILLATAAREHGWTGPELAQECNRNLAGVFRPGGLLTHRLQRCADGTTTRAKPTGPARFHQPQPWCGTCDGEYTRRREDPDTGRPLGRCPDCWTDPR